MGVPFWATSKIRLFSMRGVFPYARMPCPHRTADSGSSRGAGCRRMGGRGKRCGVAWARGPGPDVGWRLTDAAPKDLP